MGITVFRPELDMVNQHIEFVALPTGLPKLVWHRYSIVILDGIA